MTAPAPCLSIVILTEDSAREGRATIEALARRMFDLVVPGYASHRVDFIPREPREEEAMRGNVWKTDGKNPVEHERRVRLRRYIARRLLQPDTFVLFHIDGDRPWRERAESENVAKFERLIRLTLPQVMERGRASAGARLPLEHLLLICPFRSVEAWLYQNVDAAITICRREHRGEHVSALDEWRAKRGDLDEEPAPEKVVCLRKDHNLELTRGFPAQAAYDVQKSFAASVDRIVECGALTAALLRARDA